MRSAVGTLILNKNVVLGAIGSYPNISNSNKEFSPKSYSRAIFVFFLFIIINGRYIGTKDLGV